MGPGSRENPLREETHQYDFWEPGGYGPSAVIAIDALLRCVRGDKPVPVGLDDMAAALDVIDAAYQSADTGGQRVRIGIRAPG